MSENETQKPKAKEIPKAVTACPLCGVHFDSAVSANVQVTCPEDGGCGQVFLVKVYQ